jgi:hypothetical protein
MSRFSYLVKYRARQPGSTATTLNDYRTTCSCDTKVARKLDIPAEATFILSDANVVTRKGYTRKYENAAGTLVDAKAVPDATIPYIPYGKANARAVTLRMLVTAATATAKARYRILTFTFPSTLGVSKIAETLAELIPEAKIDRTATWSPGNIEPFFAIKGGRKYTIPLRAAAEAATATNVATTDAEEATILSGTESRKKSTP